jgi:hypothetical protein
MEEPQSGGNAINGGQGLHVLFLFITAESHAGIEAGEAPDDLGACEEGDAFGVIVHDVLGKVGAALLAQSQLEQHSLLHRHSILLLNQS